MQVGGPQQLTQPGLQSIEGDSAPQGLAGKAANGEKLVATTNTTSPLAKAADAMEEMSFAKNQFKDDLKDRKVKKGDDLASKILERVQKIQTIQNAQEIKDFLNKLQSNPNLSQDQLQRRLEEFSDDKLHQFAALDSAADYFEDLGDTEKAEMIRNMRDSFFEENKTAIKAGLNVSQVASELADETGLSDIRGLREGYSNYLDHVQDHKSLDKAFDQLVDTHGSENLETAVKVQLKLLATDLGCLDPSSPPERLQAVIQDMSKLKVLVGLHDGCLETEEQLQRMYPESNVEERALMKRMLTLLDQQWVTEADFDKVPDELNVSELEAQIFTMTKIVGLVRMIPEEIFANIETKQNMMSSVEGSLDSLIEQENDDDAPFVENDAEFGILGDISIPGVMDKGQAAPVSSKIPNLGAQPTRNSDESE